MIVPLLAAKFNFPSSPKQVGFVIVVKNETTGAGASVAVTVFLQLLAKVAVILYVPEAASVMLEVVPFPFVAAEVQV